MKTKSLILYKEFGPAPGLDLPSMTDSFADEAYPGQEKVVKYLSEGRKTYCAAGRACDVFTGESIPGEWCGMTDGEFSWISELAYYVEKYNLRLPAEFEKKVLSLD
ncbi:MAG: hypothetical protein IJH64_08400 [Oscillospiraceae bacterium]|nr:hypothetical protein [Oscillospiraceae bacterium]